VLAMHSRLQSKVVALDAKVDTLMLPSIFSQLPDHKLDHKTPHISLSSIIERLGRDVDRQD
jgi:hypothetical protein